MKNKWSRACCFLVVTLVISPAMAVSAEEPSGRLAAWAERISISGAIEADFTIVDPVDIGNKRSDAKSDLFVGTVELGVDAEVADWITGRVVFLKENAGSDGDEEDLTVDEATITLQREGYPFYAVLGQTVLPFGIFENHLVSDPLTEEAYEVSDAGLTVGYRGPMDLDVSLSVYQGNTMMDALHETGFFRSSDVASGEVSGVERRGTGEDGEDVESWILAASFYPIENHLGLYTSWLLEAGVGGNSTVQFGVDYDCIFINGLMFDAEYFRALNRKDYIVNGGALDEFREGAFSATLAYALGGEDERGEPGMSYAVERAHIFSEPAEVALRYERFWDDGMARKTSTWSLKSRWSLGGRYSFYTNEELGVAAFAAMEFRKSYYDDKDPAAASDSNEYFARVGIEF